MSRAHGFPPAGGHENCPLVATRTARRVHSVGGCRRLCAVGDDGLVDEAGTGRHIRRAVSRAVGVDQQPNDGGRLDGGYGVNVVSRPDPAYPLNIGSLRRLPGQDVVGEGLGSAQSGPSRPWRPGPRHAPPGDHAELRGVGYEVAAASIRFAIAGGIGSISRVSFRRPTWRVRLGFGPRAWS